MCKKNNKKKTKINIDVSIYVDNVFMMYICNV